MDKAIEAAARTLCVLEGYTASANEIARAMEEAQAAIAAYRKQREEDGFVERKRGAQLVIIESPYAGDIEANTEYARAAMRDSLERGEYPIASHLLYPQPGILDEHKPEEREWGISAGLAWRAVSDKAVFYVDRGWSGGMLAAKETYEREGFPFEVRQRIAAAAQGDQ